VRYVLATSGHIMGILSPPVDPPKRRYWAGDATACVDPLAWRESVDKVAGSWWNDWAEWLRSRCGEQVAPRAPGSAAYPPLAEAPGTYVLER
jgi:polyhydroxyalkanoate synthase